MPKGTKVQLLNASIYPTYDSKIKSSIMSGTFYIYNEKVKNNRIRITDNISKIDVPCSMTGWVNLNDIISNDNNDEG